MGMSLLRAWQLAWGEEHTVGGFSGVQKKGGMLPRIELKIVAPGEDGIAAQCLFRSMAENPMTSDRLVK